MVFMFESLEVYKKSLEFATEVYLMALSFKDRVIKDQLSRAALSVPLNIAEGQGRLHNKEKRQFYHTARGSLLECIPLIQICKNIDFLSVEKYDHFYGMANEISRMLSGLIASVKKREEGMRT
jgi:four helix bundle protein